MKTGRQTVRQEKTHFKMYKSKHGWLVAGITLLTISGVGFAAGNEVHAATDDQTSAAVTDQAKTAGDAETDTAQSKQTADSATADTQGKATTDGASSTTTTSASQNSDAATDSAAASKQEDDTSSADTQNGANTSSAGKQTAATSQAGSSASGKSASATDIQAAAPTSASAVNRTTTSAAAGTSAADSAESTTTTQTRTRVSALARTLSATTAQITANIDGSSTANDSYADGKPVNGTVAMHKINLSVTGLQKNDVITISVPNFKTISSAPNVTGMTKSMDSTGNTLTYTVSDVNSLTAGIPFYITSVNMAPGSYTGDIAMSVNGGTPVTLALTAQYTKSAIKPDLSFISYDYNVNSTQQSTVQLNSNFASKIEANNNSGNNAPTLASDYNSLQVTVPVPEGYVLNQGMTETYNNKALGVSNVWTVTQTNAGADVVFTANLSAYASGQSIVKTFYMVGAITAGAGKVSAASNPTVNMSTIYGDYAATSSNKFTMTLTNETNPLTVAISSSPLVYIAPSDVNMFNVNQSALLVSATNDKVDQVTMLIGVPTGTTSTGLNVTLADKAVTFGEDVVLNALDADGKVLATKNAADIVADSKGNLLWLPTVASPIASYKVVMNNLLNNSFGATSIAPILTTNTAPNGSVTITIPVSYTVDGQDYSTTDYTIQMTNSHTIYPGETTSPHLQANGNSTVAFQPGDKLTSGNDGQNGNHTYTVYLFDDWKRVSSYTYFDGTTVVYLPLPNNSTVLSVGTYTNVTQITENGVSYARVVIPAGTSAQPSTNSNYPEQNTFSTVPVLVTLNEDVTAADTISLPNSATTWAFMGVTDNQVDEASWKANGGTIWTIDQVRAAGYTLIADQLEAAGYTQAYMTNQFNQFNSTPFPLMVPTTFVTDQAIKGDTDAQYVSGDGTSGVANFYPTTGAITGTIRDYVGNGTQSPVAGFTSLITLPKLASGDAYSLNLSGEVSVPTGMTIAYSTSKITGIDGSALSAAQLQSFVTADQITDWTKVQSILITADSLKPSELQQVIIPFTIADSTGEAATANASSFTYADSGEGIIGGNTVLLPTRVAEAQRQVTVHYVDSDQNELSMPVTIAADAGSTLTLSAATVTGYAPLQTTQNYVVTTAAAQDVYFTYDKVALNVTVNYINQATGTKIKSTIIKAKIGDVIDLSGSTYTQLAGYTVNSNNATSYTVTAALAQSLSLYFLPQATRLTVHYVSTSGKTLMKDAILDDVYQGSTYTLTAPEIPHYTANQASQKFTVSGINQEVTFTYTPQTVTYTVNYVDVQGNVLHAANELSMLYDDNLTVDALSLTGYVLKPGTNASHEVDYAKDNGSYTFEYVGSRVVTRTINYVDVTGASVAPTQPQTVTLTQNDDGSWPTDQKFTEIDSPQITGLVAGQKTVPEMMVTDATADSVVNVVYYVVAQNDGIRDYSKTVTRTIKYVDAEGNLLAPIQVQSGTITKRNDGAWSTAGFSMVPSPKITGLVVDQAQVAAANITPDSADSTVTVVYHAPQVAGGIRDYSKTVTRTIKYVDANGDEVAAEVPQTVTITKRNDGDWSSAEFDAVDSPAISGKTATVRIVPSVAVTENSANTVVTVTYQDFPLGGGVHDYSKTFTRTIKYVDAAGTEVAPSMTQTATVSSRNGGAWSTASWDPASAPHVDGMAPLQQTVAGQTVTVDSADTTVTIQYQNVGQDTGIHDYSKTITRTIKYVDVNGKEVAASTSQTATITKRNDGDWSTANFDAVTTPKINGLVAGQKLVASAAVTADSQNSVVTVTYYTPQVGAGVHDYGKTLTRTINFVDAAGNKLADSVVQHVTLERTDVGTRQGSWTTGVWAALTTPQIGGYTTTMSNVAAQLVTGSDTDATVNVLYTRVDDGGNTDNGGSGTTTPGNGGNTSGGNGGNTTGGNGTTTPGDGGNTSGGNNGTSTPGNGGNTTGGNGTTTPGNGGNTTGGNNGTTIPGTKEPGVTGTTDEHSQLPSTAGQQNTASAAGHNVATAKLSDSVQQASAGARAQALPQTGDAANGKLSLFGMLGLALSGITALAFKNKRKED